MSFVITTVSPQTVVQVSDTRVSSLADKSVLSEVQRKSLIVMGTQAHFVIGWSGLARIGGHDTGKWLFEQLCGMNAPELTLKEIAANLTGQATLRFSALEASAHDKRCRFVLGGWHKISGESRPFWCVIFNDLDAVRHEGRLGLDWKRSPVARPEFLYSIGSFAPIERPFSVTVIGDFDPAKLKTGFKGLKRLMKKGAGKSAIGSVCRQIALQAAQYRGTINQNLISVEMDNRGHVRCSYVPEGGTEEAILPDILGTQRSFTQTTVHTALTGDQIRLRLHRKVFRRTAT